jgi:hypothetical protein
MSVANRTVRNEAVERDHARPPAATTPAVAAPTDEQQSLIDWAHGRFTTPA